VATGKCILGTLDTLRGDVDDTAALPTRTLGGREYCSKMRELQIQGKLVSKDNNSASDRAGKTAMTQPME